MQKTGTETYPSEKQTSYGRENCYSADSLGSFSNEFGFNQSANVTVGSWVGRLYFCRVRFCTRTCCKP